MEFPFDARALTCVPPSNTRIIETDWNHRKTFHSDNRRIRKEGEGEGTCCHKVSLYTYSWVRALRTNMPKKKN